MADERRVLDKQLGQHPGHYRSREVLPLALLPSLQVGRESGTKFGSRALGGVHDLGEFLLPYTTVRTAVEPDALLLNFLQRTYEAAAELGGWDRALLEA